MRATENAWPLTLSRRRLEADDWPLEERDAQSEYA